MQSLSLGLGEQWEKVKTAYAQANRALGDIVKVLSGVNELHDSHTVSMTLTKTLSSIDMSGCSVHPNARIVNCCCGATNTVTSMSI